MDSVLNTSGLSVTSLLTKEFMNRLEALRLDIKRNVKSGYAGIRRSSAKGNSLEFSDFRDYAMGDDIRRVDWNSYGRFDKLFIKLFSEEKQSTINVFLDRSKSMDFGSVNKGIYAKLFAASIAYLTLKSADKFNVFAYDKSISLEKTNTSAKNMFPTIVKFLDELSLQGETMLNKSISSIKNHRLTEGVSFIISDFFSLDGYDEAIKILQSKGQDVILIHVLANEEVEPSLDGGVRLFDSETNEFVDIYMNYDIINKYKQSLQSFKDGIVSFCKSRNVTYHYAPTETYGHVLKLITQSLT